MADDDDLIEEEEFEGDLDADIDPEELEDEPDEDDLVDPEEAGFAGDDDEIPEDDDEDDEGSAPATRRLATGEEDDDDEDIVDPDDVEADLDMILKDRLVAADDDPLEEDEEEGEVDDRGDPVDRIQPKRPGEFVCQSCFLLKHPTQLADAKKKLCADCV
jgi:hypothetical protein